MAEPVTKHHRGTTHARTAAELARPRPVPAAGGHPHSWAPWEAATRQAAGKAREEIAAALAELEAAMGSAARLLEVSEAAAAEAQGKITAAAWHAWHAQMDEAGRVYDAIMRPASSAYEQAVTRAQDRFTAAITTAGHGLDAELQAASAAKTLAGTIPAAS